MSAALRIAFVLPYGQASDGFFPDTFLGQLCADARAAGHDGRMVRVYYAGDRGEGDRAIGARLAAWLVDGRFDLIVVERLFDLAPIEVARAAIATRCALVVRGDSVEPAPGIDLIVGWQRGPTRAGTTRRAVTVWQIADAFAALVAALAVGTDPDAVPGVARVADDVIVHSTPLPPERAARRPIAPALDHEVIAHGAPPPITRHTVFGNAGCPYAADPRALPMYRDLTWPAALEVAQLGCAFCSMGGDYQRRSDDEVVTSVVDQALHVLTLAPTTRELVLDDQAALRYLAPLMHAAAAAGVPPVRWLIAARSDTLVRERPKLEAAIAAAAAGGHAIEIYLTGFEAFADAELERYNKGTTVDEQLAAVAILRALAAAHPTAFGYAGARGHSLLLWNPWTTPEDLATTIGNVRRHGLVELFDELGRNRLRLYPDLPIFHAAATAGALVDAWQPDDHGTGAGKGYHRERPWRFLDPRTRLAWRLAERLRAQLGLLTEAIQLEAIAQFTAAWRGDADAVAPTVAQLERDLDALADRLRALATRRDAPPRGHQVRASVVRVVGPCNNGCPTCPNGERQQSEPARARVEAARSAGAPVVIAGREPTLRDDLAALVTAARGDEGRPVGIVSNGRRCAYRPYARHLVDAGLTGASIKVFAPLASAADAIARVDGAHAQACAGIDALVAAGVAVEARLGLHRDNLATAAQVVELAGARRVTQLRIEVALDAIGLDHLAATLAAIDTIVARAAHAGLPLEVSPLDAGPTLVGWLPVLPSAPR